MSLRNPEKELACVNSIRCLAADMVQKANSGHPGMPIAMAPVAHILFSKILKLSSDNPNWPNRDRFVLSNGHGCALYYVMLHLSGYKISLDDLKNFRQLDSNTPGHPESIETNGVEVTTGPLGQGIANAVGMAISKTHFASIFNKPGYNIIDHKIYVFCGDGCLQEGISSEAASLAGHLKLKDIILIYDDNRITIDGSTDLSFTEDVPARFRSYGWNTMEILNGNTDYKSIEETILVAKTSDRPTLISLHTTIGFGSPKADTAAVHGAPLGSENLRLTKKYFGLDEDVDFFVSDSVRSIYKKVIENGNKEELS